MRQIILFFFFSLALPAGALPAFNLPSLERGVVLRRDNRVEGSYQAVRDVGSGPGLLITFPPREIKSISGTALRISGRTALPARVRINGKPVRVYPTGSFVGRVPLSPGENLIPITAADGAGKTEYILKLTRGSARPEKLTEKKFPRPRLGTVINPHAPLQLVPGGTRLLTLPEGTVLKVTGRTKNYFQVRLSDSLSASVRKKDIRLGGVFPPRPFAAGNVVFDPSGSRVTFECQTSVPVRLEYISPREFRLIFYNSILGTEEINLREWEGDCWWETDTGGEAAFHLRGPLNCYRWDLNYRDGAYRLELKGKPRGRKGVRVMIDPGHGGYEIGALSPSGIEEKEINLLVARGLARRLEKKGIRCFLSRTGDKRLGLYERTELARKEGADILLSLHFNAVGASQDPRKKSGCSVFYYRLPSRELAGAIYQRLTAAGIKGDGVRWKSLAVIRPPGRIAVLAEIAYLTSLEDEGRLLKEDYLSRIGAALAEGVEEYLSRSSKE